MKLLAEELEKYSQQIKTSKEEITKLNGIYKQFFDRDIRRELEKQRIKLKKLKEKSKILLYENTEELKLLKKHFPAFFEELEKDPYVSSSINSVKWLLDFKELSKKDAEKEIKSLQEKRKQLKEAKKSILSFSRVDYSSLKKFNILEELLKSTPSKEELLEWIEEKDKALKKEGWLILLNYPFIEVYVKDYLKKYKEALEEENSFHDAYLELSNQGTLSESEAIKNLKNASKKRKSMERRCIHMLYANPGYLRKLKSSKRLTSEFSDFENKFIDSVEMKHITEEEWVKEMQKLISP